MTALSLGFGLYYLTEIGGLTWRPTDYNVRNIVRGIKGEPFNGYSDLSVGGKFRRYDKDNIHEFVPHLMAAMGKKLRDHVKGSFSLIPIPSSAMAVGATGSFRIVDLAAHVAKGYGNGASVVPAIRWEKRRTPAHKSGEFRSPDLYQPHMRLVEKPKGPLVLFDDVLTSGSQMIAAGRFLSENLQTPTFAVVGARVTSSQHDKMISWRVDTLELDRGKISLDDLLG